MAIGFNSGIPYPAGGRPALKLSAYVLDDQTLFNTHKARVLADGGIIPDEVGCLARITWLLDNGIYNKVESAINPAFGVKMNANKEVSKLYSLFPNDDYVSVLQGVGEPVRYDDSGDAPSVTIKITSNGGSYLKSEKNRHVQRGRQYAIGGRMADKDRADSLGIMAGVSINGLPMAYLRTQITNQQKDIEAWRYGTRDSTWTGSGVNGDAVGAARTPYADYVPSAALFDVDGGVIRGYETGALKVPAESKTGKLADLTLFPAIIYVGQTFANGNVQPCYGSLQDIIFLHTADDSDAVAISRLGM
ncbi:hypothetical protein [Serratia quinivorans]|uniref:hypothetical protein n=1 Tax=Serratia quinivorans TaxID=137545 RepID=UPI0021780B44|nr:hypothetical protein [Serratia quinivorans]CAI0766884.1 Uncharacterised protein [Serratia quinivorans]CAI2049807.1 Uncharacterised protein [Serratia quinivorans]